MFLGRALFSERDDLGEVNVFDDGFRRYLTFGQSEEQSCQLKAEPFLLQHDYTRAMLLVLLFIEPRSMMLLGVGGGCLATTLHHYFPSMKMHLVELRPLVIEVAQRFFQLPHSQQVQLSVTDAVAFIQREDLSAVDVLFCDLYSAEGVAEAQTKAEFIVDCEKVLKPSGWLVINYWRQQRDDPDVLAALKAHFSDVRICATAEGNWVIFAGKQVDRQSSGQLKSSAKKHSRLLGYSLLPFLNRTQQVR